MHRRRLLKALASAPGCFASGAFAGLHARSAAVGDTLLAFAEALLGTEAAAAASREVLLEHLVLSVQPDAALRSEYRACARLLDGLAGVPFWTLPIAARQDLLARNGLVPGTALETFPDEASAREVRTFVVPDLIAAYYRSPMGWAAVGYAAFPGRCAGLAEYTRAPT